MSTHYNTLGVPNAATTEEINRAFKKLALQYHPDKAGLNAEAHSQFIKIKAAQEILSELSSRTSYDRSLGLCSQQPTRASHTNPSRSHPTPEWDQSAPRRDNQTRRFRSHQDPQGRADHPDATRFNPSPEVEQLIQENERRYAALQQSLAESLREVPAPFFADHLPYFQSQIHQKRLDQLLRTLTKNAEFDAAILLAYRKIREKHGRRFRKSSRKLDEITIIDKELKIVVEKFRNWRTLDPLGTGILDFSSWFDKLGNSGALVELEIMNGPLPVLPGDEEYVEPWQQAMYDAGV